MDSDHSDSARAIVDRATELVERDLARCRHHGMRRASPYLLMSISARAIEQACAEFFASPAAKDRARSVWAAMHRLRPAPAPVQDADVPNDADPADKPRGRGRPQEGDEPRDKRIFVMVTESDVERIDAWAMEHGVSRSSAMLMMARQRMRADGF